MSNEAELVPGRLRLAQTHDMKQEKSTAEPIVQNVLESSGPKAMSKVPSNARSTLARTLLKLHQRINSQIGEATCTSVVGTCIYADLRYASLRRCLCPSPMRVLTTINLLCYY